MFSKTVKTHWNLAIRGLKKAVEVTIKEIINRLKIRYQMNKKYDALSVRRNLYITLDKMENEEVLQ